VPRPIGLPTGPSPPLQGRPKQWLRLRRAATGAVGPHPRHTQIGVAESAPSVRSAPGTYPSVYHRLYQLGSLFHKVPKIRVEVTKCASNILLHRYSSRTPTRKASSYVLYKGTWREFS
jgi:hypothetical protein